MTHSKQFYAIKRGRMNGIFQTWAQCEPYVKGFKEAVYKGFDSHKEALDYLGIREQTPQELAKWEVEQTLYFSRNPSITNAYVDGSYHEHDYGGAFIVIKQGVIVYERSKRGTNPKAAETIGPFAGELQAAMLAIQYALNQGSKRLLLYHDNQLIRDLIQKKKKTKDLFEKQYVAFVTDCQTKGNLDIDFIKVKAHNKGRNKWNDYVDKLAVSARKSNVEVNRDLVLIRQRLAAIEKNVCPFTKKERGQIQIMKQKLHSKNPLPLSIEEEEWVNSYVGRIEKEKKKTEIQETNTLPSFDWTYTYQLVQKGLSFRSLVEQLNVDKHIIVEHLRKAKLKQKDICLDGYLPLEKKNVKKRDRSLVASILAGMSWEGLRKASGLSEANLLSKLCFLYMARAIPSVDEVYARRGVPVKEGEKEQEIALAEVGVTTVADVQTDSKKKKEEEKEKEEKERFKRCLTFLKIHRVYMKKEEREKANYIYLAVKRDKCVTTTQKDYLFALAKQVNKRKKVVSLTTVPPFSKSYYLVKMGLSLKEVASVQKLPCESVICDLVTAYLHGGSIDLRRFLTQPAAYEWILQKLKLYGATKALLNGSLPASISYEDIKIVAVMNGYPFQS